MEKKFLNSSEFMEQIGVSYPTLLRLCRSGEIPFVKVGRGLRFPVSYLEQLNGKAVGGAE